MVKQEMSSGLCQGTTFTVIPLNRESNCTYREKSHSQFLYDLLTWPELQVRPWMWCLNAALTIIGMSKGTEIYQMRGRVSHASPCWMKSLQTGTHGPGSGRQKKQTTSMPDHVWPEIWKNMSDAAQRKEKPKWAIEKPKHDNVRKLNGIYFIDPTDAQFKETWSR